MNQRTDYTTMWLAVAALLIALWATTVDQPPDLNNDRCWESIGGTEQC